MSTRPRMRAASLRASDVSVAPTENTQRELRRIVEALQARKAVNLIVLDLRSVSDAADYFIIASGSSDTHVRALAEHVLELLRQMGERPHHEEGVDAGRWALLDFVDCVVHIFHPTLREYYQLERLWADAATVPVDTLGD